MDEILSVKAEFLDNSYHDDMMLNFDYEETAMKQEDNNEDFLDHSKKYVPNVKSPRPELIHCPKAMNIKREFFHEEWSDFMAQDVSVKDESFQEFESKNTSRKRCADEYTNLHQISRKKCVKKEFFHEEWQSLIDSGVVKDVSVKNESESSPLLDMKSFLQDCVERTDLKDLIKLDHEYAKPSQEKSEDYKSELYSDPRQTLNEQVKPYKSDTCQNESGASINQSVYVGHTSGQEVRQVICDNNDDNVQYAFESFENLDIPKEYTCKYCHEAYPDNYTLLRHIQRSLEKKANGNYKCEFCKKIFQYRCQLSKHRVTHTECPHCGKIHLDYNSLVAHVTYMLNHRSVDKMCSVCKRTFQYRCQLEKHLTTHSEKTFNSRNNPKLRSRPFSCSVCNKSFTRKHHLIEHERIHSGSRSFSCSVCNKSFTRKSNLVQHERIHSGSKPFSCSVCNKSFTQKAHLIQHEKIHSGSRPFSCSVCNKSFARKSHLTRHEKIHSRSNFYSRSTEKLH